MTTSPERPVERSSLGPLTLTALVVGNMIGAGVFTTSGFALADLGSPVRVLAAWLVGGLLALCGALGYGALCRLIPASGGEYLYLSRALHPIAGFVAGWISLLAGFTAAISYAASTLAVYLLPEGDSVTRSAVASAVIVTAALLHGVRLGVGTRVQDAAVGLKLLAMLAFAAFAAFGPGVSSWEGLGELREGAYEAPPFSIGAFGLSLMWISFSYAGFNAAVYVAGEVPSARHRVPRALIWGTVLTTAFYLLLNAVFVLVPPFEVVAGREDVAIAAALAVGGEPLAAGIRFIVVLALFTSVSAMVMVGPRVYAKMADDGLMPQMLRLRGEVPTLAVLLQAALAIVVVWLAGLRELLSYLGFTLSLSAALTVASLFAVVRRDPALARGLPGYPWAPAVFVVFTVVFAALSVRRQPIEVAAALATIGSGIALYLLVRRRHQSH